MTQPPLDELRYHPLPQLADALRAATPAVLDRWRNEVTQLLPDADVLTRRQLENSLPDVLEQTAAALESAQPGPTDRLIAASPVHGTTRFHQEFRFDELMVEYSILRRIVLQEVISRLGGRPLSCDEIVALGEALDVAQRQAAVAFAAHQSAELRAEANAMAKYLSFLSHDLRGGLNGVMLLIEVLRRDLQNDPKYATNVEDLDSMRRSMLETVGTMDRFLSAEKLRRGRMPVKVEEVHVRSLFNDVTRTYVYQAKEQGQQIEIHADDGLHVRTDRELVLMILQNLLSNAIKYGRGKPVRLEASCPEGLPGDAACRITVRDQGPGISQERLSTLFVPFTRGETYGQRGIGLGLFIARQSADLIHARLWAESTVGAGTAFHLDLPRTPPRPEQPASPA